MKKNLFRKKSLESISSPEQLTDYLRVTNPGIWAVLLAVFFLLAGLFAWAAAGTLETSVKAKAVVEDGMAQVFETDAKDYEIKTGMLLRISSEEEKVSSVDVDESGRTVAYASVSLPDGTYDAKIITEQIHPIQFLFQSR